MRRSLLFDFLVFIPAGEIEPKAEHPEEHEAYQDVGHALGVNQEILQRIKSVFHSVLP